MGTSKGESFRTKGWTDMATRCKNCTPLVGKGNKKIFVDYVQHIKTSKKVENKPFTL